VHHLLGAALWELGERNEAVACWRQALELQPDFPEAHNDLGVALRELGQLDEAVTCYQRALTQKPDYVDAYNNLGNVWQEQKKRDAAATCFQRALELDPNCSAAYNNLGNLLYEQGELEEAVASYRRALAVQSDHAEALSNLGKSLYRLGRMSEAIEVWRQWLAYDPDNPVARHMLAALTGQDVPPRASDEYVRNTFDSFARTFDQQLQRLDYHAPDLIAAVTEKILGTPAGNLDVLDAGCGTGLCGPLLKPFARRLTGVDLSAGMILKARTRHIYNELITVELTVHLEATAESYDLVASADTLVYFGDLKPVLAAAAHAIRPRGILIFTIEQADRSAPDRPGFHLQQHGRYCHTEQYVRDTLAEVGLCLHDMSFVILRTEQGQPVHGLLVSACKVDVT
jgi:predicted TPR repeat methyltransferase